MFFYTHKLFSERNDHSALFFDLFGLFVKERAHLFDFTRNFHQNHLKFFDSLVHEFLYPHVPLVRG